MPTRIPADQIQSSQQIEAIVSTAEGAGRLLSLNGQFGVDFSAVAASSQETERRETFAVLVGPVLTHQQFLRATGSASIIGLAITSAKVPGSFDYGILSVEADWDDESGQAELKIEVSARASGTGNSIAIRGIAFQVTLLVAQAAATPPSPDPTGAQTAVLAAMTSAYDFGVVLVGESRQFSATIANTGDADSGMPQISLSGPNGVEFSVLGGAGGMQGPVPAGGQSSLTINFAPLSTGPKNAALQVSAIPGGEVTIALSGAGMTATPTPTPSGPLPALLLPSPRFLHAMAFDESRHVLVLYGGVSGSGQLLGDIWEFDGQAWNPRSAPGPAGRMSCGMVYHPILQKVVMFGGRGQSPNGFNDTWLWDGINWTSLVPPVSPPARSAFGMAFDHPGDRVVLFGGRGSGSPGFQDTWTFDGATWQQQTWVGPMPPARFGPGMASGNQGMLLHGGRGANAILLNDTWKWSSGIWIMLNPAVAPRLVSAGNHMLWDDVQGQLSILGLDEQGSTQAYRWDGLNWQGVPGIPPIPARSTFGHAFVSDWHSLAWMISGGAEVQDWPADPLMTPAGQVTDAMLWLKPGVSPAWASNPNG